MSIQDFKEAACLPRTMNDIKCTVNACLKNQLAYNVIANYEKKVKLMSSDLASELLLILRKDLADGFGSIRKLFEQQGHGVVGPPTMRKEYSHELVDLSKLAEQQAQAPQQAGSGDIGSGMFGGKGFLERLAPSRIDMNGMGEVVANENGDVATFRLNIFSDIDALIRHLDCANQTISSYEQKLRDKDHVVESMKNEMKSLNESIAVKNKDLDQLQKLIAKQEFNISNFHVLVEDQKRELCNVRLNAEAKDKEISNLKNLLELADEKLDERLTQMEKMASGVDQLTQFIADVKVNETSQMQFVHSIFESVQTSLSSWTEIREHIKQVSTRKINEESVVKKTVIPGEIAEHL